MMTMDDVIAHHRALGKTFADEMPEDGTPSTHAMRLRGRAERLAYIIDEMISALGESLPDDVRQEMLARIKTFPPPLLAYVSTPEEFIQFLMKLRDGARMVARHDG
jgi:hypothetical protein